MAIRVMLTMGSFPTRWGGTEKLVQALCPLLADRGVELTIVSRPYRSHAPETPGATVIHSATRRGKIPAALTYVQSVLRSARQVRPQVIHAQSLLSPTSAAILAGRRLGVPVVATVHGGGTGGEIDRLGRLRRGGSARLRFIRRGVDRFVVISDEIDRELASFGVRSEVRHVIPNGVDTTRFRPPEVEDRQAARSRHELVGEPTAVYVGRVVEGKGVDTLLDAFGDVRDQVPDARLLVVGDGDLRAGLEAVAGPGVHFVGGVADVARELWASDVFVLPSLAEGLPLSLLEAMACERAVVSTDVGAAREVVGDAGRIVPPGDRSALSSALTELLADPELRRRMGTRGRRRVLEGYDLRQTADRLASLYEEVASGSAAGSSPGEAAG